MSCAPIAPLPAQITILNRQIERARAAGLQLPRTFGVRWVQRFDEYICAGATHRDRNGHVTMFLDGYASPHNLARTIAHELQHVADLSSTCVYDRVTLERRAEDFAVQMAGWRA